MEVMQNANKGLEQERARQDWEQVRRIFGPAPSASLFNDQAQDLPAAGAADEPIVRIGGGGSKRSFEHELKRLLRQ